MKKRNPLAVFVLSIITLGIYDLYWLVKTKAVLNKETDYKIPSIWLLFLPFLLLVVGYIIIVADVSNGYSTVGNGNFTYGTNTGVGSGTANNIHSGAVIGFILTGVGFVATFFVSAYWFYKFSKAINQYTEGRMNTSVTFLILWIIHLIGVALIQDTFNDMIDGIPAAGAARTGNASPSHAAHEHSHTEHKS